MIGRACQFCLITATALLLSACSSISYYSQSIVGHTRLMMARQPIARVMADAGPELSRQLELAQELKKFAVTELALPDNDSYLTYVPLKRKYPVWTVVAAPEFSLQAKSWCYPVIGCASYRGFFARQDADRYAASLNKQGLETSVAGAVAYSTLGWFADPLLPSMMRNGDIVLVETLLHELAHQQLYVKGDSAFNEAFATVVGEQGTLRWLQHRQSEKIAQYRARLKASGQFDQLITDLKVDLAEVFDSAANPAHKRQLKNRLLADVQHRYEVMKQQHWNGRGWYDGWFKTPLNNARLAAYSTYRHKVPALEQLLQSCGGVFQQFYSTLKNVEQNGTSTIPETCDPA